MSIVTPNFDQYFESIQTKTKVGELEDVQAKVTGLSEYRSQKSGKTSIRLTINVNGSEIYTYLGYSNEKSAEISKARLIKLAIAALGFDGTKKLYEDSANDEDVSNDAELIVEIATKLNKKLKKNPVDVIVSRKKEGDFWDTKFHLPDSDEPALPEESKAKPEDADDFLGEIAEEAK